MVERIRMNLSNPMDPAHTPLSAPPLGLTSNFINPNSKAKAVKSVIIICMIFVFISFAMRMCARLGIKRTFRKDDGKTYKSCSVIILKCNSRMSVSSGLCWSTNSSICRLKYSLGGHDSLLCDLLVE